jgi:hypothetical protein
VYGLELSGDEEGVTFPFVLRFSFMILSSCSNNDEVSCVVCGEVVVLLMKLVLFGSFLTVSFLVCTIRGR